MRIAYDNLVDDLNASTLTALTTATGYSVLDVQDQRLSTRWLSSTATTQSVTVELDTFPAWPDSSTGTTAIYHFATSAESWTGSGGVATSGTIAGVLRLTATTASSSIVHAGLTIASGATFIMRARADVATTFTILRGASTVSTITGVTTSWATYTAVIAGGATATTLSVVGNNTASTGTVLDADWIYVGDGTYTTQLEDLSGNGNHGTVVGATPTEGIIGRALSFDGTNDRATYATVRTSTKTMSAWIKFTATTADMRLIQENYGSGTAALFLLSIATKKISFLWRKDVSNADSLVSAADYNDGAWHLTTIVHDGTTAYLYIDGSLNTSKASTLYDVAPDSTGYIASNATPAAFYAGSLDDARIYNRALSADEVAHLYAGEHWIGENNGLAGRWDVDAGLGVDTAAIMGHNLLTGTTVKVQATDNNADWTDPEVNEQMTVNDDVILKFLSSSAYYKYWRFSITGQASIQIGRLWLGEYLTIDPSSLLNFKVVQKGSDTVIHGRNRQKFAVLGVGWRRFELSFPNTEEEMINELNRLYDAVGNHHSLIFCNFDTIRDYALVEPCYCSIDGEVGFLHSNRMKFTYSLNLEEDK